MKYNIQINGNLAETYSDVYTPEALSALSALAYFNQDIKEAMAARIQRRAARQQQKQRILELNQQRDELAVMQLDVESAQQTLDTALERFSQTSMAGEINQADVAVLTQAVPPIYPISPDVKGYLFLALVLGVMLSLGAALLLELLSPRVRSAEDIDLPVLGTLKKRKYQHKALPNTELLPQK